ncbi:gluconate 2-dehydrogenase subunit 3 family protein [Paenibacillus filicis]|uniref:Gluconate 2-dehydrogenase subunit 3 family protein n=1 Tax=Paenibacillus filicis TaxID=669464 RepID=A0ABU9DUJ8_9BACL
MTIKRLTRYPSYDIMSQRDEWDPHTRRLVMDRLLTSGTYNFLTPVEAEMLRTLCCLIMDDDRPEVCQYVLDHIDQTLDQGKESQRQPGIPAAPQLIRAGLLALDTACQTLYTKRYFHLTPERQQAMLEELCKGEAVPLDLWKDVPVLAWFNKLLGLTIDAYYSHPEIWSEIGHGGPAYPRGYVRMHPGEPDPWEAKEPRKVPVDDEA